MSAKIMQHYEIFAGFSIKERNTVNLEAILFLPEKSSSLQK